jgi:hypothetical protein
MDDWQERRELEAAKKALKDAENWTPPEDKPMRLLGQPSDDSPFTSPGSVVSPSEQSLSKFASTQEPSMASQYFNQLGSNLGKAADVTGLSTAASQGLGLMGDVGEAAGTLYRYPGRVAGNLMAGEQPFKSDEFQGALSDLGAPLRRLAHWNNPQMVPEPTPGQGLSGKTIGESMEALSGPFDNTSDKIGLKPGVSPWDAARMVGGGLAGLGSEMLSLPGGLLPGVPNPAELAGAKVASGTARLGIPNPSLLQAASGLTRTAQELLGVAKSTPPGENLFQSAVRRGAVNLPGKPQLSEELSGRIDGLAYQVSDGDNDKFASAWAAATERAREVAGMDDRAVKSLMNDAIKSWQAKEAPRGVQFKDANQVRDVRSSVQGSPDESLGLSPEAEREILGEPDLATGKATTYAPRNDVPEDYAARLARVEKAVAEGGDPQAVMADAGKLKREDVWRITEDLGGDAERNKQKGLDFIRQQLEEKALEPKNPPTTIEGIQEARELKDAKAAMEQANAPVAPPVDKEKVFVSVQDMRLEGRNDLASKALKDAGLSERDYSQWRKGREVAPKPSPLGDEPAAAEVPQGESPPPSGPGTPPHTRPEPNEPMNREPRLPSHFSREGISYPKIASTVREDFTGYYANRPNSERANELANRVGAIEHRGRNNAMQLMPEAAKADESMVKSQGWRETGRRPARKEMLEQIQDPSVPNFSYYKFTAGIDDAVANRVGRPQFNDPRAKQWVEQTYPALYHDTGEAFQNAGGLQRGANGQVHPFEHDPASTQGPHVDNMIEPWMGDPTNPKMKRYAEDLASIPENKAAGVTAEQVIKDTSEIRSNADKREAFENDRRVPIKPDIWRDPADGQTHLVNAAALRLIPSKEFGGGLQPWFLKQHVRAAVVEDIGTPSLMDTDQGLNYYRQPGGLREGVVSEAEARNPGTGAGAGDAADRMLAAMMGNSEHAGYNFSQKLAPDSAPMRAIREGLKTSAESAIARTWFKSLLQPYFEIPGMAPGGTLNRLAYVGKTAGLQARYLSASGLRAAEDWLRIPGGRNLASKIASTEAEQMSAQGVSTNFTEALTAGFKGASKDMGVDLFSGPKAGMERAGDLTAKAAEKGFRVMGVWNVLSNKLNNFVAGLHDWTASKLGEDMAKDYLSLAREGKLNQQQIQRLERMGANPDSIEEVAKINDGVKSGVVTPADPMFDAQFGKELARAVPWDTQFRGASPLRRQRFLNDKFYGQLFKFMTFQMGTVRHGEEFFNELQSAKTLSDRMDAVGRLAFRVGGSQLQGEVARGLADLAGKDRTQLEDDSTLGRIGMNMIYSSFMGPLWLAFDYAAQKANIDRPWAKRGSHTEQALGPKDMIFNTQPVETFLQLTGAPVMAGLAETGIVDRKPGHEDDSLLDPFKKAVMRQAAVNDAGRVLFGNEAMNAGAKGGGHSSSTRGLFEKSGSNRGLFEKNQPTRGLFEKSKTRGLFEKAN